MLVTALPAGSLPRDELGAAGVARVVVKPFEARGFVRVVSECLGAPAQRSA